MPTGNTFIDRWVDQVRALTTPDRVVVCDGSEAERERNHGRMPGLGRAHRAQPGSPCQAACSTAAPATTSLAPSTSPSSAPLNSDAVGPTNNWMAPDQARAKLTPLFQRLHGGPDDVRRAVSDGPARLAVLESRRRDHRQPLRRLEHADDDARRRRGPRRARRVRSTSRAACTRSATCRPSGGSSCTSPKKTRSGRSDRATAAMPCWARSASRCAWPAGWRARKAGSPSTC